MDCPICGKLFSYVEKPLSSKDDIVFIRCTNCSASFTQPVVDPINILKPEEDVLDIFSGATTAPADAENVLNKLESMMKEFDYGDMDHGAEILEEQNIVDTGEDLELV